MIDELLQQGAVVPEAAHKADHQQFSTLPGGIQHALDYRTKADDEISLDSFKGDYTKKIKRFF
jgi:hypothetical protein